MALHPTMLLAVYHVGIHPKTIHINRHLVVHIWAILVALLLDFHPNTNGPYRGGLPGIGVMAPPSQSTHAPPFGGGPLGGTSNPLAMPPPRGGPLGPRPLESIESPLQNPRKRRL